MLLIALQAGCRTAEVDGGSTADGTPVEIARLHFRLPVGWQVGAPSSAMRVAEATIAGPGGAAEMAVFHFGEGQGGGIDANIERWISQVDLDPSTPPRRDEMQLGVLKITWIEVGGTLLPSSMGMGPTTAQPGSLLLGAVIEGPGGPWFFKATGPRATLAPQRDAFLAMLRSARPR